MSNKHKLYSAELHGKISELITLDNQRQYEQISKHPVVISIEPGNPKCDALIDDILDKKPVQISNALIELSPDELAYVMALMWYGRGDDKSEHGSTFDAVLAHAQTAIDEMTVGYLMGKPLGKYLADGLKRLDEENKL